MRSTFVEHLKKIKKEKNVNWNPIAITGPDSDSIRWIPLWPQHQNGRLRICNIPDFPPPPSRFTSRSTMEHLENWSIGRKYLWFCFDLWIQCGLLLPELCSPSHSCFIRHSDLGGRFSTPSPPGGCHPVHHTHLFTSPTLIMLLPTLLAWVLRLLIALEHSWLSATLNCKSHTIAMHRLLMDDALMAGQFPYGYNPLTSVILSRSFFDALLFKVKRICQRQTTETREQRSGSSRPKTLTVRRPPKPCPRRPTITFTCFLVKTNSSGSTTWDIRHQLQY